MQDVAEHPEPANEQFTQKAEEAVLPPAPAEDARTFADYVPPSPMPVNEPPIMAEGSVRLRVYVRRSGDDEQDKRRLRQVHGKLYEKPGNDTFCIVLFGSGSSIEIDFPNETTDYKDVTDELEKILGPDAIQVIQI